MASAWTPPTPTPYAHPPPSTLDARPAAKPRAILERMQTPLLSLQQKNRTSRSTASSEQGPPARGQLSS